MAATTATTDGRTTTGRRAAKSLVGLALVGSALIVGGALLPWLSLYGGLDHLRGVDGTNGRVLLAGGLLAATAGLVYAVRPSVSLRWIIGAIGFAASGFAAWDLSQLLGTYRELQADPFAVANLGPGAFLAVAGGLVVLGTMLLPSEAPDRAMAVRPVQLDARNVLRNGMIVFLVGAAMIHLSVVGPHLQESTLYAVFFICAAIAQVGLAALVALRGGRTLLLGIAALNVLFMAVWV
ncbi:MAG: hypothetical protein M3R48_06855, partial [Candidatus Dormibacteraeota bacterium]|nr:hypothetical protein [Candidatus Dormibacteraeota bacterium]